MVLLLYRYIRLTIYLDITSLGDDLTYSLVKPILERCSPEHLLRLEQASPVWLQDLIRILLWNLTLLSDSTYKKTRHVCLTGFDFVRMAFG